MNCKKCGSELQGTDCYCPFGCSQITGFGNVELGKLTTNATEVKYIQMVPNLSMFSTAELITELEKRLPNCDNCKSHGTCSHLEPCNNCIAFMTMGLKDNFKPKENSK